MTGNPDGHVTSNKLITVTNIMSLTFKCLPPVYHHERIILVSIIERTRVAFQSLRAYLIVEELGLCDTDNDQVSEGDGQQPGGLEDGFHRLRSLKRKGMNRGRFKTVSGISQI